MADSGHVQNLENLRKAILFATGWGASYIPSNPQLAIAAMQTLADNAETALDDVQTALAPYRAATAAAADDFELLSPLVVRCQKAATSLGLKESFLEDLKTPARKIKGQRAVPVKDDPDTPADEAEKSISASQMDRQSRIENFDAFIALLDGEPKYTPNETDLTIHQLQTFSAQLQTRVDNVQSQFVPYSNKLAARDHVFYTEDPNVFTVGTHFKAYVDSAFTRNSTEWNQIKGLRFRNLKRTK